jgi:predicted Zn-dependent protease
MEAANILSAVARLTSKPPFLDRLEHSLRLTVAQRRSQDALQSLNAAIGAEAQGIYQAAIGRRPDDWMLRYNYAQLLTDMGQHSAALPEYAKIAKMFPQNRIFRHSYAMALLYAQQPREAAAEFAAVLKIDPEFGPAAQGLAQAKTKTGK